MLWMFERAGKRNKNNEKYQFWQQHNHPVALWSNDALQTNLDYFHNNPVKAGFVEEPQDWLYSSARNYSDRKGLIDVIFVK